MSNIPYRTHLSEEDIPRYWYNMRADMKEQHDPYIHPGRMNEAVFEDFQPVFCDELIKQELNTTDRLIEIPEGIREVYKLFRPSPLCRAYNLERSWAHQPKSTISSRATTHRAATSSILLCPKSIMPRNRASRT